MQGTNMWEYFLCSQTKLVTVLKTYKYLVRLAI